MKLASCNRMLVAVVGSVSLVVDCTGPTDDELCRALAATKHIYVSEVVPLGYDYDG